MSEHVELLLYQELKPERLDKFLVSQLGEYSRARLQGLIRNGFVLVNHVPAIKTGMKIETGDAVEIRIPPAQPSKLEPQYIPLDIIFENDDLIVVNKKAGMVVHPGAGHQDGTLVQAVLAHAPQISGIGGEIRPGVVHRLDKDTSGIILLAKIDSTHLWLQNQFRLRKVKKIYHALVDGAPPSANGRIEASIGRATSHRKLMAVVADQKGRAAISEYFTLESFPHHTLLEVHPTTGRTHQIRLHLKFIGCPVAGDTIYGNRHSSIPLTRHFLHAYQITLTLPGEKEARTFTAALPEELLKVLDQLRKS
jgi:23S rRNA pseudouridine1911/1915/1917 synthase